MILSTFLCIWGSYNRNGFMGGIEPRNLLNKPMFIAQVKLMLLCKEVGLFQCTIALYLGSVSAKHNFITTELLWCKVVVNDYAIFSLPLESDLVTIQCGQVAILDPDAQDSHNQQLAQTQSTHSTCHRHKSFTVKEGSESMHSEYTPYSYYFVC